MQPQCALSANGEDDQHWQSRLADIAGLHDMPTQMLWLSDTAQTVLTYTINTFSVAHPSRAINYFAKDFTGCGWTVLALGKLGAGELNFSSDVDLIVLHDTNNAPFDSQDAVQPFCYDDTQSYPIIEHKNAGRHWLAC